jgi:hypothetical protein
MVVMTVDQLAATMSSGALLDLLRAESGGFELLDHWQQGEFHHDFILSVRDPVGLPGRILVVATNCNAGVKEVICFDRPPARGALWHSRCPDNVEFIGDLPHVLASARTRHWFDPCTLLQPDARSEYREEFRERQLGGGWLLKAGGAAEPE